MNIAFFGSPQIAALLLDKLIQEQNRLFDIKLVVTQPDKPAGKRLEIQPTAVKKKAQAYNIPFFDKELKMNQQELIELLDEYHIELCIIFAYGEIINTELLTHPRYGFWNIHPSLLPLYRGPAPAAYSLMLGDTVTGTSLIKLVAKMDAGPIIEQRKIQITPHDNRNTIEERLTLIGVDLLITNIQKLVNTKKVDSTAQNEMEATYTRLFKKEHGYIPVELLTKALQSESISINECPVLLKEYLEKYRQNNLSDMYQAHLILFNYYRALTPWPGIWTRIMIQDVERRLKITHLSLEQNTLTIDSVQLEGKSEVPFKTFNSTYRIF